MSQLLNQSGFYAVIATTTLKPMPLAMQQRYMAMAERMLELAQSQDGFLGREHARDDQLGISVSYWSTLEAIEAWRTDTRHMAVKEMGRKEFYRTCQIRICRVEREYCMDGQNSGLS
jgi:heme-degrading monooxygenase HmoA